eukprot:3652065-Pyramimonas_sp.AAC.1
MGPHYWSLCIIIGHTGVGHAGEPPLPGDVERLLERPRGELRLRTLEAERHDGRQQGAGGGFGHFGQVGDEAGGHDGVLDGHPPLHPRDESHLRV